MNATASQSDLFLDVQSRRGGQIKGECRTEGHTDEIALISWSWGAHAGDSVGNSERTGRRQYLPLVVNKFIDVATVMLLSALARNDEVKVTLTMRKAGGEALDYCKLMLENARIVDIGYDVGDDGVTQERVAFSFTAFEFEYRDQDASGSGGGAVAFSDEVLPT